MEPFILDENLSVDLLSADINRALLYDCVCGFTGRAANKVGYWVTLMYSNTTNSYVVETVRATHKRRLTTVTICQKCGSPEFRYLAWNPVSQNNPNSSDVPCWTLR